MSTKHINYLTRSYDDFVQQLLEFTKQYYPELSDSFNDASVGKWLMELYAAVGDDLSYHIDRVYQNTNLDSTNSMNAVMNMARAAGLKVPGKKAGMCEVEFTCTLPVLITNGSAGPNWKYAPLIKRGTQVSSGNYVFETLDNVDFAEQFNNLGYSNRKYKPIIGNNGNLSGYEVSKTALVSNIESHIYKKTLVSGEVYPFMEIILPDQNVCGIESIIFKESSSYSGEPSREEFYYNSEVFKLPNESIHTRRFFEVDALVDQYVFGSVDGTDGEMYTDYYEDGEPVQRVYKGAWKGVQQKFITEYTDNGYLKITFGAGSNYDELPDTSTPGEKIMNRIVNNDMLGILPKAGWTMFILYNTTNGQVANLGKGAINAINNLAVSLPETATLQQNRSAVVSSIKVSNTSDIIGGRDFPSVEEIKNLIRYSVGAMRRATVIDDYKYIISQMPAKYGCPFRTSVKEENNKVIVSLLNVHADGTLDSSLPSTMLENIVNFTSLYKHLGDYVAVRSGKIYNLGINVELFIGKAYNAPTVLRNVKDVIKDYMDVKNHKMGEDIFVGDLTRAIMDVDGVISVIDLSVYNLYDGEYSEDICPLEREIVQKTCENPEELPFTSTKNGSKSFKIDLSKTDQVLFADDDSMFEIKFPDNDITMKPILK